MIIVVRHGRTGANASGLLLGRLDPPLDPEGVRQAECLPSVLAGAARTVSSPLRRARQTAAALGLPVTIDERWIELDYGALDGTPLVDVAPEVWSTWRADSAWAPEGGESLSSLGDRVREACLDLADEAAARDVVVVTHVSPVKAAVGWALGVGDEVAWRMYVAPASIARIGVDRRGPVLRSFNETAHLAAPQRT